MSSVEVPIIGGGRRNPTPVPESVLALENPVTTIHKVVIQVRRGRPTGTQYHFFYGHSMFQGANSCIKAIIDECQIQGPALLVRFDSYNKRYGDLTTAEWEREDGPARVALRT